MEGIQDRRQKPNIIPNNIDILCSLGNVKIQTNDVNTQ